MSKYDDYLLFFSSKLGRKNFVIRKGEGCVMVSAPHSAEQFRNGRKKYGEYLTGVLVNMIADDVGCPVIYKEKNCRDDANYDEKCRYKKALAKYVKRNGVRFLIDLHQMSPERDEMIDIGTGYGKNIEARPSFAEEIKACFEGAGFDRVTIDVPFASVHPFTVSSFISRECGIPCIQIEFNTRLLSKRYAECRYDDVLRALEGLIGRLNGKETE